MAAMPSIHADGDPPWALLMFIMGGATEIASKVKCRATKQCRTSVRQDNMDTGSCICGLT